MLCTDERVLYEGKEHEILFIYENQYFEIREIDSLRRTVKLVHASELKEINHVKIEAKE